MRLVPFSYILEIVANYVTIYGSIFMKVLGVPPWYSEHSVAKFHKSEGFRGL